MEEELEETVNIQSFNYQNNLLAASRDSKIYLATTPQNKNLRPLVFKGYSEAVLNDPIKEKKFIQEVKFLWKLSQKQNILQILSQHYRDRMVFIITQYCEGGSLALSLKNYGSFTEEKSISYIKQIINGYRAIKQASIIHRNLEPSNILISGLELKIADYSDAIERRDTLLTCKKEEIVGNLLFQPPEVLEKYSYSQKSDVYAIGMIFLSMLKGSSPFTGETKTEIVSQKKDLNIQSLFDQGLSRKSKLFLEKSLCYDLEKRMEVDQMLNYTFYEVPQLALTKLFNFDVETPQKSFSKIAVPSMLENFQPSTKMVKLLEIINDSVPQKSKRKTSTTSIRLKISQELDLSRFQNPKDLSIIIPSILSIKQANKGNIQTIKKVSDDKVEFQPSIMILPSEKDRSSSSKKSNKTLLKEDVIMQQKPQHYNDSTQIKPTRLKHQQFTARTLDTDRRKRKEQVYTTISTTNPVKKKGTQIKVLIHSPYKIDSLKNQSQSTIRWSPICQSVDLGLMLCQIDMTRLLSRAVYYISRLKFIETKQLQETLQGLRLKMFNQIRELTLVDQKLAASFKNSVEYLQLLEVVGIYQSKCNKQAQFYSFQKTIKMLQNAISQVFKKIKGQTKIAQGELKALYYMVACWQLISILKKRNLQVFQKQSNIEERLKNEIQGAQISQLLELYGRMLKLKLIEQ